MFSSLLLTFLDSWNFNEEAKSFVMKSFESNYQESFFSSEKILSLSEEYNILWDVANTICFGD